MTTATATDYRNELTVLLPTQCPFCGCADVRTQVVEWRAQSLEPLDASNVAVIQEHQCTGEDCLRSFWTA